MIGYLSGVPIATTTTSSWTINGNEIRAAQGSAGLRRGFARFDDRSTLTGNLITGNPAAGIATSGTTASLTI